jgi:hypothetical protein
MRSIVLCAVVGLLGAGCSDESPIGPDPDVTSSSGNSMGGDGAGANSAGLGYENGSRLVARNIVATDGASQFLSWYDSELKIACYFQETTDGLRCAPQGPSASATVFADAACTVPAAITEACAPAPSHVLMRADALCSFDGVRVFKAGPKLSTAYSNTNGCTEVPASDYAYYGAGDEVPASSLVAASVE